MRIGILSHNYPVNSKESKDAGKFVYAFSNELAKKADVFVLCPDYGGNKEKYKNVPVTWFKWNGPEGKFGNWGLFSPVSAFNFFKLTYFGSRETVKFVNKNKINYLLCFWNFPAGVFGLWSKYKTGIRYSTWALGSDINIYPKLPIARQIIQLVLQGADKTFGNSYNICRKIGKITGVKAEFLPTSNLIRLSDYKRTKLPRNKFNFLTIARLEKVKGPDILIEAARILKEKTNNFTITLIGGGSMFEDLKQKVKEYDLGRNANILGYLEDQAIVNGYLKDVDCLVMPSRSESFPLVATEALQTGLPMIGSNVGDIPAFIGKNKLGFIFEKENPSDLANLMYKMIKQGKKLRVKNKKKMSDLSKQFELDKIVIKFLNAIKE